MKNKRKWKLKPVPAVITGLVVAAGIATIATAAYRSSSSQPQQTATVSVSQKNLKGDAVNTATQANTAQTTVEIQFDDTAVAVGTVLKVTALVTPQDTDHALVWNSSNEDVFTVDKDGVVTVKGTGLAALTATVGTVSDAVTIQGIASVADGSDRGLPVYTGGSGNSMAQASVSNNRANTGSSGDVAIVANSGNGVSNGAGVTNSAVNQSGEQSNDNRSSDNVTPANDNADNNQGNNYASDNVPNTDNIVVTPAVPENPNVTPNTPSSNSSGAQSSQIADALPSMGFTQRMSNVYVCEDAGTYYGEIITQPNVTIIYIKQRSAAFDGLIQNVLASLLPSESSQVWSNYLSATSDRTFEAEGRRVRIVTALNGGHSQIVIYN